MCKKSKIDCIDNRFKETTNLNLLIIPKGFYFNSVLIPISNKSGFKRVRKKNCNQNPIRIHLKHIKNLTYTQYFALEHNSFIVNKKK